MTGVQTCALPICFPVTICRGAVGIDAVAIVGNGEFGIDVVEIVGSCEFGERRKVFGGTYVDGGVECRNVFGVVYEMGKGETRLG